MGECDEARESQNTVKRKAEGGVKSFEASPSSQIWRKCSEDYAVEDGILVSDDFML